MSSSPPQRSGRTVVVTFIVLLVAFTALVTWLVTGPVRALKQRPVRPADAPAAPAAAPPGP